MTPPHRTGRRLLRWLAGALALLLATLGAMWFAGSRLPLEHTARVEVRLSAPIEEVWSVVRDLEGGAAWREGVSAVRRLADRDGRAVYEEDNSFGTLAYAIEADEPPSRLATRLLDQTAFGGTWTYALASTSDGGTRVTLTEDGEIHAPLFRFLTRYVFGYDGTLRSYADSLERRFAP